MQTTGKRVLVYKKMAKAASEDANVVQSLTDPILSGDISLSNEWSSKDIVLYVTTAISVFSLIVFILTLLNLRKVLIILSVLENAQPVRASTLPSFVYQKVKTTEQPPKFFLETFDIATEHLILALCICILFCLIVLTVYTIRCRSRKIFIG